MSKYITIEVKCDTELSEDDAAQKLLSLVSKMSVAGFEVSEPIVVNVSSD